MLSSRKELYALTRDYYIKLLERTAKRYESRYIPTLVDHVGYECTRQEELFRPLWGIAPLLGDKEFKIRVGDATLHVCDFITRVITEGTAEASSHRFDRHVPAGAESSFANQCVTEIAAYLITVRFARKELWDSLEQSQRDVIAKWIHRQALIALKNSWPNNHWWYPIFCIEILKELGYYDEEAEPYLKKGYAALEELYVGNGWYCDGKDFGRFDYYEAWAHHAYTLLWTLVADKNAEGYAEKRERYLRRSEEFLRFFAHYFDTDGGVPAYGRSLSYRFAMVSAFGLAAVAGCDIDMGLAKSIILKNIDYYFTKSIPTEDGCFPCGYLYASDRFGENYASDGATSCYTEGFMCLLAPEEHPLWQSEAAPLLIDRGDYTVECEAEGLDILIKAEKAFGGVTLYNNAVHYFQKVNSAFNDMAGYYGKFCYNSRSGFSISSRDKAGLDNMISLSTADASMESLRTKIYTVSSTADMQVSYHYPFANDKDSVIKSWVLPLSQGYHVRIHKVKLGQSYRVSEGGYCVGVTDDGVQFEGGTVTYGNTVSSLEVVSSVPVKLGPRTIHPGMHNLSPLAYYPVWRTENMLEAGEYIFVSTVFFSTDERPADKPHILINENSVTVSFDGSTKTVEL